MNRSEPLAYRVNDACRVSGLSRTTIYRLAKEGRLTIRKVCGRSLIARSELLDLLKLQ